jgi:O-acetyl-ADP-ribose deacetylase (regulator of RNase III)
MSIHYITGDLFANHYQAEAFAHGCNCQGAMGAGIAVGFKQRYPDMYQEYRQRCKAEPRQFSLGDVFLWQECDQPAVFNLATQGGYWQARASYQAIEAALRSMKELADAHNIRSIAMPRIGVGYGGLSWKKVCTVVEKVFSDWPGTLIVYEEYVAE